MRPIDADFLIDCIKSQMGTGEVLFDEVMKRFIGILDKTPTIDTVSVVHGEWIRTFDGNEWYWYCSNCKEEWYEEDLWMGGNEFPHFCPNCGARMFAKDMNVPNKIGEIVKQILMKGADDEVR